MQIDFTQHPVEVPLVAGVQAPPAQLIGVGLPELGAPPPDRRVTDHDTASQHHLLNLMEAQRKPEVQPHAVVNELDRVAVTLIQRQLRCSPHRSSQGFTHTHQHDGAAGDRDEPCM
jgi:hypothetical protein